MAKYRFQCEKCSVIVERYASVSADTLPCKECGANTKRLFPNIGSKKVTEVVDTFLNVRQEEDHRKEIESRRIEHFWGVEVPRLVQSGTYSIETCLENNWLVYNEKGELVLGKPIKQPK